MDDDGEIARILQATSMVDRRLRGKESSGDLTSTLLRLTGEVESIIGYLMPSQVDSSRVSVRLLDARPLSDLRQCVEDLCRVEMVGEAGRTSALRLSWSLMALIRILRGAIGPGDERAPGWYREMEKHSAQIDSIVEGLHAVHLTRLIGEADEVVAHAREAAGETAAYSLGEHYARFARSENRTADLLRLVVVVILLSIAGAGAALFYTLGPVADFQEEIGKLLVTFPMLILAYYLSRESSRHRSAADRARDVEVRLRTVRAYTSELPDSQMHEIRASLAKVVFGGPLWAVAEEPNAVGAETMQAIGSALNAVQGTAAKKSSQA